MFGGWGSPEGQWALWKFDPDGNLAAGFPIKYNYLNYYFVQDVAQGIALDREGNIIGSGFRGVSGYDGSLTNDAEQTVKVPAPASAERVTVPKAIWKKIFLKPGASGGAVDWKAVGTKQDNGKVESDVLTFEIAGPTPAGNPSIGPTSKSGVPTRRWENECNSKFKVWFGSTAGSAKKKSFTFVVPNPAAGNGTSSKTLTSGQWNAVRKLVADADGATIYWYVESWDAMKRSGKTGTMSFQLSP